MAYVVAYVVAYTANVETVVSLSIPFSRWSMVSSGVWSRLDDKSVIGVRNRSAFGYVFLINRENYILI